MNAIFKLPFIAFSLAILSVPSVASESASGAVGSALTRPGDYLGQIMVSLLLVLLIIFVSAWLLRRYGRFSAVADGNLRVLASLSVGQRERIMLLQVGKDQLLVGVTSSQISTLHTLDEPIQLNEAGNPAESFSFSQRLQDALKQRSSGETR